MTPRERRNRHRAARAREALRQYAIDSFGPQQAAVELAQDPRSLLADLLTDLRHFADARGLDFAQAVESSAGHHHGETVGDDFDPDPLPPKHRRKAAQG